MYKELRKKAEKKVQAKMAFYICAIVFSFTSVLLVMLSFALPAISFWLQLPIPVFIMVLGIMYLAIFGLPSSGTLSDNWKDEEIEREMIRLYRQEKGRLPAAEDDSEAHVLKLKELERLEQKRGWDEDMV